MHNVSNLYRYLSVCLPGFTYVRPPALTFGNPNNWAMVLKKFSRKNYLTLNNCLHCDIYCDLTI